MKVRFAIHYLIIMFFYSVQNEDGTKVEYRIWNPFRSKLAAAIIGGVDSIWMVIGLFFLLVYLAYFEIIVKLKF